MIAAFLYLVRNPPMLVIIIWRQQVVKERNDQMSQEHPHVYTDGAKMCKLWVYQLEDDHFCLASEITLLLETLQVSG